MDPALTLEAARRRLVIALAATMLFGTPFAFLLLRLIDPAMRAEGAALITLAMLAHLAALLAGIRAHSRLGGSIMGVLGIVMPVAAALTLAPPALAPWAMACGVCGVLIASTLGARLIAPVASIGLIALLFLLPSIRPDVGATESHFVGYFVFLLTALGAVGARLRDHSDRALDRSLSAAARSEAGFRAIAETAPVPILLVGVDDHKVLYANRRAARAVGRELSELEGLDVQTLAGDSDVPALFALLAQSGELRAHEVKAFDGAWISVWARVIEHDERQVAVCALYDITMHKHMEERLARARDEAEAESAARTSFLANISHELRTPMNGILGMLQLLDQTPLERDPKEMVARARRSAESLLGLIDDVLDFAKIEAGRIDLEHIEFVVEDVIFDVLDLLAERAQMKGLELTGAIAPDVPRVLRGDPTRMRQVLLNLVANAVKFTESGFVEVKCGLAAQSEGIAALTFGVEDSGVGIAPDAQERIFAAFMQADASTTRRFGGTGLGLAIAKELVELMGGELTLDSTVDKGTTFSFSVLTEIVDDRPYTRYDRAVHVALRGARASANLCAALESRGFRLVAEEDADIVISDERRAAPAILVAALGAGGDVSLPLRPGAVVARLVERPSTPPVSAPDPNRPPRGRLLLAEDNETNQLVARLLLERLGYEVDVVSDGRACVERATHSSADYIAILMDCQMPELDGYEATREIRRARRDIPIFALTAHAADHDRAKEAGMSGYLQKPLRPERLERELARIVQ